MPPDTHELVPKPSRASSNIYKFGLKLKDGSTNKLCFACFGSPLCRNNTKKGIYIGISEKSASNANDHIKHKHNAGE